MKKIEDNFKKVKKRYDNLIDYDEGEVRKILEDLRKNTFLGNNKLDKVDRLDLHFNADKTYFCFSKKGSEKKLSRPINQDLYLSNEDFKQVYDKDFFFEKDLNEELLNKVLYTISMSFCACYDLWKNARKTPGTYFEIVLGTILFIRLKEYTKSKHISIPEQSESLSTDIVFTRKRKTHNTDIVFKNEDSGLVFPSKITTRERIVYSC